MNKKILTVLFFLVFIFEFAVSKSEQNNFLYIFDASGSMAQKMENRTKFDIAKEILIETVNELPRDVGVSLLYFGSVSKKTKNIQFAVPLKNKNKEKMREEIDKLRPGGLTPLAESLSIAAAELEKENTDAIFIVITDGKEKCGGNPIKVIQDLAKKGQNIEIHIIGLAVNDETRDQLEKIAAAGGGYFYDATSAMQLKNSLKNVTDAKLGEQVLKLTAAAGIVKMSKNLYSMDKDEVLKIKFRPAESIDKDSGDKKIIYFDFGDVRIELENTRGEWALYKRIGDFSERLIWPTGLTIRSGRWNYMSCGSSKEQNIISFNRTRIHTYKKEKDIEFKVGVQGCESSFKDLTTEIPLY